MNIRNLDELLDYLEEHIDEEHQAKVEKLHLDALAYKDTPYVPLTTVFTPEGVTPYPYVEAFHEPEKMLFNELIKTVGGVSALSSVMAKDHGALHVRSNHGIGIIASLFGANCRIVNDNLPWVDEMSVEQIEKAVSHGIPDLNTALPARVYENHQYFLEKLKQYPKCYRNIHVTQPDLQGPFDVAHILLGQEVYYMVYEDPELLHELLNIVTDTCIEYLKSMEPYVTDKAGDHAIYIHGDIYPGHTLVKDDCAIQNLSESMYEEFSGVYNKRLLDAVGGGSIHYCGKSRAWHFPQLEKTGMVGINYGNPELLDAKFVKEYWEPRKIPNVFWGDGLRLERQRDFDYVQQMKDLGIKTGLSLVARYDNLEEAKEAIRRHTEGVEL